MDAGEFLRIVPRLAIFALGSYGIIRMSIPSLKSPRSHGFYRAFAFESLLALFLINVPAWLETPLAPLQLASWILLVASAVLAVHGFAVLRRRGRPAGALESTTVLVRSGMYRLIRHPLYASLLYLGWAICLKAPTALTIVLAAIATVLLFLTAKAEEQESIAKFGPAYLEYMADTKRFIPFIF